MMDNTLLVDLLDVIREEMTNTEAFHEVPPLDSIISRYHTAKSKLKKILFYRYREVGIVSSRVVVVLDDMI
jgi:hypothetical protein